MEGMILMDKWIRLVVSNTLFDDNRNKNIIDTKYRTVSKKEVEKLIDCMLKNTIKDIK